MNQSIKHIGVFTSGGDSPGMNAVLYAIAKAAEANGIKAIRYFNSEGPHHPSVLRYLRAVCIARNIPDERQKFFDNFHPELYAEECARMIKAEGESGQKYLITSNLQKIF